MMECEDEECDLEEEHIWQNRVPEKVPDVNKILQKNLKKRSLREELLSLEEKNARIEREGLRSGARPANVSDNENVFHNSTFPLAHFKEEQLLEKNRAIYQGKMDQIRREAQKCNDEIKYEPSISVLNSKREELIESIRDLEDQIQAQKNKKRKLLEPTKVVHDKKGFGVFMGNESPIPPATPTQSELEDFPPAPAPVPPPLPPPPLPPLPPPPLPPPPLPPPPLL